ncbi:DUF4365 domain-containing protein [Ilyomonas limi]|uniref:DUF4365 domain-containing protein n=1 Tax=Ilyomonas limi TaxID=2575867 RepID=A0A4U3KRX2_9BACT|nr:DUF4365 domain-containing protein [Ilyomonas limi]TKK64369.1 DUF4365 domain-containing protein [Ilyomonas limi]
MLNSFDLDEMDLPSTNPNEELETISNHFFKPLFDVKKFEIHSIEFRDKGVDFQIEIKKAAKHTNFHFAVQLKATDSKEVNKDGSISLQLYTSNINYLLNNTMPAYYVLFYKPTEVFYYENLNDFVKDLSEKDSEWQKQKSHNLRFCKKLTNQVIEVIYTTTIKKGLLHRKVNEKLILTTSSLPVNDKILIGKDLNVVEDSQIRNLVEEIGFTLINEGKWNEIISVNKKASGGVSTTAKYNLILGIANYYSGDLINSLSFLKETIKLQVELPPELKTLLKYFEASVKSSLGLITESDYQKRMDDLENADTVGLYIKLEKVKAEYYNSLEKDSEEKYDQLLKNINEIINDSNADDGIKVNAKCELILITGSKNNWDYVKSVAQLNAAEAFMGVNQKLRVECAKQFTRSKSVWFKDIQTFKEELLRSKNYFVYYNVSINEAKVIYEMIVFTSLISASQAMPDPPSPETQENRQMINSLCKKVNDAIDFYKHIGHIENEVVALSTKYELLHYIKDFENANATLMQAENLIDAYELFDKGRRIKHLKSNGTTHQKFKVWIEEVWNQVNKTTAEYEEMVAKMDEMDEQERKEKARLQDCLHIHLFPIGFFMFPRSKKEIVYKILNIKDEQVKGNYDRMFELVIPVANIYYNEITQEGFSNGKLADRGIESWRNIYRIRKAFFENKFYREERIY